MAKMNTQWKRILIPTDFSEHSEKAALLAIDMAKRYQAEVRVLHIIDVQPITMYGAVPVWSVEEIEPQLLEVAKKSMVDLVEKLQRELGNKQKITSNVISTTSSVAQAVCDDAKENHMDAIIIATHGRTGLNRLLIGSVAEQVVRHADCPVVVVPTRN